MHATAQREEQVSSAPIDLNPPVRAESIDLRVLVSHRTATPASASVESVAEIFKSGNANFVAVLEGQRLLGMCSRQETAALLGGRYGFSLWARKPIRDHLCKQETRIKVATPIGDVLRTVFARPDENFYDDVLLVNESGGFVGFIGTETLFKVQNALLLTNIREIEERDREIRQKNEQMETDLRMATELQQALMPSTYPTFPADAAAGATKLSFCHRYLAATLMGGDFFHIARLSDDTAAICICDVMGHGVRAALITAMMRAMIETHAVEATRARSAPHATEQRVHGNFETDRHACFRDGALLRDQRQRRHRPFRARGSPTAVAGAPKFRRSADDHHGRGFRRTCDRDHSERAV